MRKSLSSVVLGLSLISPACKSKRESPDIDLASTESTAMHASATMDDPPPPDDTPESGGAGPAMALDEGKLGKRQQDNLAARKQAIEAARNAGVLGSSARNGPGAFGTGNGGFGAGRVAGTMDVSSGFDEAYHDWGKHPWIDAAKDHLSTFAADVDTASYTLARRKLTEGALPPSAAVRVEEFVNYFRYRFPEPAAGTPFAVVMDAAPSPLSPGRHILRVGVATKAKSPTERKPAHLVFLVDVSGSMAAPDRLDLAKRSLRILTNNLKDGDTVALVTYAGSTELILPATASPTRPTS